MFIAGIIAIVIGLGILSLFTCRKISRELRIKQLLKENIVVEINDLDIKAPVLEGTDKDTLSIGAGHFKDTGSVGSGNFCIAGHSSVIYKEYFNNLKNAEIGMQINLYDKNKNCYTYFVTDSFVVYPDETWVLNDFDDDRITIVTCTDNGAQRQVVVGKIRAS